jgi:hypothetical protein
MYLTAQKESVFLCRLTAGVGALLCLLWGVVAASFFQTVQDEAINQESLITAGSQSAAGDFTQSELWLPWSGVDWGHDDMYLLLAITASIFSVQTVRTCIYGFRPRAAAPVRC